MANTAKKSNKLVALFKKTAQKLVSNPKAINKELKKLALTLPLMALLVEEVRAAQKKVSIDAAAVSGEVFEDETALADFIEAQNLDPAQYAEIEQELEGVVLAKAGPYEDLVDQPAHISHYDSVTAQDYLLADSGTGVQPEVGAAGAEVPFTPASLPVVPPALGGLVGGAAAAVGAAAIINNQNTTAATPADTPVVIPPDTPTEVQAEGSHLTTSLKDLQKLGVDFVAPASGQGSINVELGAGVAFGSTTGIPLFGDTNRDGIISAAEDSALSVNLSIANSAQLSEVAALGNLASFGIDSVSIDLANQALLNTLANNSTLAADLAAIRANGLTVNTIDMASNAAILTDAQAAGFINNGLSFSAEDTITLNATEGTHLSTSLKDLQKLGVDNVNGVGHISVDLGANTDAIGTATTATTGSAFSTTGLPKFATGLDVTLNVDGAQIGQLTNNAAAAALANANIDHLQVNLAATQTVAGTQNLASGLTNATSPDFVNSLNNLLNTSGLSTLGTQIDTTIDLGGSAFVGHVGISQAQASTLIADGLHFAAADSITLQAEAGTTHLSTSLKDLQKLGVDAVTVAGAATGADLHVTLGDGAAINFANGALPSFGLTDSALNVTLDVNSVSQLAEVATLAAPANVNLAALGLDNVQLNLASQTELEALFASNIGNNSSFDQSLSAVRAEGLSVTTIDMGSTAAVHLSDVQAAALLQDGLHFAAADSITLQAEAGTTHLSTSLKDLQKLGVDAVTVAGAATGADLHVTLGDGAAINFANGVLPSFGLTDSALNVTLDVNGVSQLAEVATLAAPANVNLAALGLDNVQLNLASQTELEALFASNIGNNSSFDQSLSAVRAEGLSVTTIDMGSTDAVHLSDVQAAALLQDGLHFAVNDSITLQAEAGTTHLSTSLKDLQKLGVDMVTAAGGVTDVHLNLGGGDALDLHAGLLPTFDSALNVTLDVNSEAQLHELATILSPSTAGHISLNDLHIDQVQLHVDNQTSLDALLADSHLHSDLAIVQADVTVAHAATIDAVSSLHVTQAQTAVLQTEHLHFAQNDHVTFDASAAEATHMGTQLSSIHNLGVNTLSVSDHGGDSSHIDTAHFATLVNDVQTAGFEHLGLFSSDLLNNQNLLDAVQHFDWSSTNLDIALEVDSITNNGSLEQTFTALTGIDVLSGANLTPGETWGTLIQTLQDAGLGDVEIQKNTGNTVHITDDLSAALYDSGMLHALPDANIAIDAGANKVLNTSLKAMADLGVDSVNADHKVYVELGLKPEDVHTLADLGDLFSAFGLHSAAPDTHLFGQQGAGLVIDQTTFSNLGAQGVQALVADLSKLGFTEIDVKGATKVDHVYEITQAVAQTPVLSEVQIVGSVATDLAHVFDPDIFHKAVK